MVSSSVRVFLTLLILLAAVVLGQTFDEYPNDGVVVGRTYTIKYSPKDAVSLCCMLTGYIELKISSSLQNSPYTKVLWVSCHPLEYVLHILILKLS
jgi:hypothetical protein